MEQIRIKRLKLLELYAAGLDLKIHILIRRKSQSCNHSIRKLSFVFQQSSLFASLEYFLIKIVLHVLHFACSGMTKRKCIILQANSIINSKPFILNFQFLGIKTAQCFLKVRSLTSIQLDEATLTSFCLEMPLNESKHFLSVGMCQCVKEVRNQLIRYYTVTFQQEFNRQHISWKFNKSIIKQKRFCEKIMMPFPFKKKFCNFFIVEVVCKQDYSSGIILLCAR